jgi:hypothetical protein
MATASFLVCVGCVLRSPCKSCGELPAKIPMDMIGLERLTSRPSPVHSVCASPSGQWTCYLSLQALSTVQCVGI